MNTKFIFCLALIFLGGLFAGCSIFRGNPAGQTNDFPMYLYSGSEKDGSASRFLSTRIRFGEEFYVGGNDFLDLKGRIIWQGTKLFAALMMNTGQQAQLYQGNITLEKPFFAQGGAASGGAGAQFWFIVSTNSNCRMILEHINSVMGYTNAPFSHSTMIYNLPVNSNTSNSIGPTNGLPLIDQSYKINPLTGLPFSPKHND